MTGAFLDVSSSQQAVLVIVKLLLLAFALLQLGPTVLCSLLSASQVVAKAHSPRRYLFHEGRAFREGCLLELFLESSGLLQTTAP